MTSSAALACALRQAAARLISRNTTGMGRSAASRLGVAAPYAARSIMGDVAKGIDPASERKKAKVHEALTLSALLTDWHALHLASKRPSYATEALRALRSAFARCLDLPAADLSRVTVVRTLDAMSRKGSAAMAARTSAYGKAAYGWGVKRGTLSENPFANLPVAPTLKRERVLTDDELAAIWRGTDGPGPFNGIVRVAILTGQRRDEVAGMTWAELSDNAWTIPASRTKNGATHIVPLSAQAQDLLRSLPQFGELVFPGLRLVEGESGSGRKVWRGGLALARFKTHGSHRPPAARGSPRSHRASSQSCLGQPGRDRRDISAS
jgi:integrase